MDLDEAQLSGGFVGAVDVLKKAFFSATSRKPYVLSTRTYHNVQVNEVLSNSLGEHLRIRFEEDFYRRNGGDVIVERK
ncbi:hypothetical protein AAVH_42429 [Aphelenchoides avenae]|nr:hypothetical protein AAVH_42429 [Aphelenchus avenae]